MDQQNAPIASLHPLMADILQGAAVAQLAAARAYAESQICPQRADYEVALRKHDWSHEFSDDFDAYRKGRQELQALRKQQARIDPLFVIWNSIAPPQCRGGRSYS